MYKVDTRFTSCDYDPVQGITEDTTFSGSAIERYTTKHAFAVKPANVTPGRCKPDLPAASEFLVDVTLS